MHKNKAFISRVVQRAYRSQQSFLEQLSTSGGNFLFFLITARLLGPDEFGLFAIYLVPAQIAYSVAAQWILLPITTTTGSAVDHLARTSILRWVILALATPPFAILFVILTDQVVNFVKFCFVVTALTIGLTFYDILRYLAIRLGFVKLQIFVNGIRWLMSFFVIFGLQWSFLAGEIQAITAFIAGIFSGIIISAIGLVRKIKEPILINRSPSTFNIQDGKALLSLGIANAVFTFITSSALTQISVSSFGAIQAFRSLVNWAPLILQYMETHFASKLVRNGVTEFTNFKWLLTFSAFTAIGELALFFWGDWIIYITLGPQFSKYNWLLLFMFALVMIQSYTRTVGIEVRLKAANSVIWVQSTVVIFGVTIIGAAMLFFKKYLTTELCVIIIVAIAILQAIAMIVGTNRARIEQ